jgi:hypothetical protein
MQNDNWEDLDLVGKQKRMKKRKICAGKRKPIEIGKFRARGVREQNWKD